MITADEQSQDRSGILDDVVQPFVIDRSQLRGRLIRLGGVLDEILTRHDYPAPVAHLLGETATLAVTLASGLKFDGILTLQIKGNGPVTLLVTDVEQATAESGIGQDRQLRGYARFDRTALERGAGEERDNDAPPLTVTDLVGDGVLAITIDQGEFTERYQGIVELRGDTLTDCILHYFRQSDQVDSGLKVAVAHTPSDGWRAGAFAVQRLPEEAPAVGSTEEDGWRRAMILMGSCSDAELVDGDLPVYDLLYRLFHEDGVRVFEPSDVRVGCRCSEDRLARALRSIPRAELDQVQVDGEMRISCDFCNKTYRYTQADLDRLYADA